MPNIPNKPFNNNSVKDAGIDDPVAIKVSWGPAKAGGAGFKAERLIVSEDRIVIKKTTEALLFALVFVGLGGATMFYSIYLIIKGDKILWAVVLIACGLFWGSAGIVFFRNRNCLTFDKSLGRYFFGKYKGHSTELDRCKGGQLRDIYAIQIVSEFCEGGGVSDGVEFISYEANLVFPDGNRLNIIDHAMVEDVVGAAVKLSEFLGVPLWQPEWEQGGTHERETACRAAQATPEVH